MSEPDYQVLLDDIAQRSEGLQRDGHVAEYIPELAKVSPNHFGISLITVDGREFHSG
ncbi:MAG: glutaminase, partial [Verrucomicrobiota bacterium JB023]|nr:glutaminase [Verrucomicrobiota bacterium JB023]